jgi:hypothetical protein
VVRAPGTASCRRPTCGIHPFGEAIDPQGRHMAAVNVRCLEGVDPEALRITRYDGRSA